jgi:hypothetical protein
MFDKIVIVTKKTQVEELTKQFNQVLQAKFHIITLQKELEKLSPLI